MESNGVKQNAGVLSFSKLSVPLKIVYSVFSVFKLNWILFSAYIDAGN